MRRRQFEPSDRYCPARFVNQEKQDGLQEGGWRREVTDYVGLATMQRQLGSNNYSRDAKALKS